MLSTGVYQSCKEDIEQEIGYKPGIEVRSGAKR
jgi:hypothetical protein